MPSAQQPDASTAAAWTRGRRWATTAAHTSILATLILTNFDALLHSQGKAASLAQHCTYGGAAGCCFTLNAAAIALHTVLEAHAACCVLRAVLAWLQVGRNIVHGSDSVENGERETGEALLLGCVKGDACAACAYCPGKSAALRLQCSSAIVGS